MSEDNTEQIQKEARRSRAKIARLPQATRDRLNRLLADGVSYGDVLQEIGDEVSHIAEQDIGRWFHSGHKLWLKQQCWLEHVQGTFELAKDMVEENKAI